MTQCTARRNELLEDLNTKRYGKKIMKTKVLGEERMERMEERQYLKK